MTQYRRLITGIFYLIVSAFFFALMAAFVRLAGDLPSPQKAMFRNLIAAIAAAVYMIRHRIPFRAEKRQNLRWVLARSISGLTGVLMNFYAIDRLNLGNASVLNKFSTFAAIIFSVFILGEAASAVQILIVAGAFTGVLLVIKPSPANMMLFPSIIGFLSGVCAGLAYTCLRRATRGGENGKFIVFFFSAFSTIVLLPWVLTHYAPMTAQQTIFLLLAGTAAAGGQFAITAAYSYAPAKEISIYDYSQIIFSTALGYFLFGQVPDLLSIIGCAVIISMAVLMYLYNRKRAVA
jgi:drug/metabolite transporter (DMT)-like permease